MNLKLKRLTEADLEFTRKLRNDNREFFFYDKEIGALEQILWFKKVRRDKKLFFYVIVLDKIRVGTISYRAGEIGNVIIDKPYRRKGYMRLAFALLFRRHKGPFFLKVVPTNVRALRAYKALGFQEKEKTLWK